MAATFITNRAAALLSVAWLSTPNSQTKRLDTLAWTTFMSGSNFVGWIFPEVNGLVAPESDSDVLVWYSTPALAAGTWFEMLQALSIFGLQTRICCFRDNFIPCWALRSVSINGRPSLGLSITAPSFWGCCNLRTIRTRALNRSRAFTLSADSYCSAENRWSRRM